MAVKVCLVSRRKNEKFFSIEKVFAVLIPFLSRRVLIEEVAVPHFTSGLGSVFKNIAFVRRSCRGDVYHITGDIHYVALGLPASRTVLTIHDCVFMHTTSGIKRMIFKWIFLDMPVKRAAVVTTISESSRNEIIQFSKCDPGKVVVIPNSVNGDIQYKEADFNSAKPSILFIGSTRNKNLERVISALQGLSCKLRIIGNPDDELRGALVQAGVEYVIYNGLSEMELAAQYSACDMVLFPSTYEGFGLPVIEGQKAGRAVITSNISPMKEVAGGAACLVDPFDTVSIRQAVIKIIEDKVYREQLVEAGLQNVKQYDSANIAERFSELYEKISKQ